MLRKKFTAEFVGTLLLLAIVVGSGIMGYRLCGGNLAIALLANSMATGFGLIVLIWIFGPISGAHFNPLVTLICLFQGIQTKKEAVLYLIAQFSGAICGVFIAHFMFGDALISISTHDRGGISQMFSEFIASFGLILVIRMVHDKEKTPFAVGAYIASAYWFTASTSFANPAATVARAFTSSFAGIAPSNILNFIFAQLLGAFAAVLVSRWHRSEQE